jgi:A/G-specific adenine glycosylase
VWVSAIMLQQTRVDQVLPYYSNFIAQFPTISALATAPLDLVLKSWEGLGYYSRARNLHSAAKQIMSDFNGNFPDTYEDIIKLKGVGMYTAAAISSFVYGAPRAVLDGNVLRVLSRVFAIDASIDKTLVRAQFQILADQLIDITMPGQFNQAIMDLGATVCTPSNPDCSSCCFSSICLARISDETHRFPIRTPKPSKTHRYFHYLVGFFGSNVLVQQRNKKDIWQNLYEFPMIEKLMPGPINFADIKRHHKDLSAVSFNLIHTSKQTLTHQVIHAAFYKVQFSDQLQPKKYQSTPLASLDSLAFPKTIRGFLDQKIIH